MNPVIYAVEINDKKEIGLHARPITKIGAAVNKLKEQKNDKDAKISVMKLNDDADITKNITFTEQEGLSGTNLKGQKVSAKDFSTDMKANALSLLNFLGLQVKNKSKIVFIIESSHGEEIKEIIKSVLKEEKLIK